MKNLVKIGTILSKIEQKAINGGNTQAQCESLGFPWEWSECWGCVLVYGEIPACD